MKCHNKCNFSQIFKGVLCTVYTPAMNNMLTENMNPFSLTASLPGLCSVKTSLKVYNAETHKKLVIPP